VEKIASTTSLQSDSKMTDAMPYCQVKASRRLRASASEWEEVYKEYLSRCLAL